MKNYHIGFFLALSLNACGPSSIEIEAREKAKADSIAVAAQEKLLRQQAEAKKQEELRNMLIDLKSKLEIEKLKFAEVQKFQLFRTPDEKDQQISEKAKIIETLKARIKEVQKLIDN